MSTPLQRAEELKSLISQYQAELSDIYSEIHVAKEIDDKSQIIFSLETSNRALEEFNKMIANFVSSNQSFSNELFNLAQASQDTKQDLAYSNTYGGSYEGYLRGWSGTRYGNSKKSQIQYNSVSIFAFQPLMVI